jgi:hypothetical protein
MAAVRRQSGTGLTHNLQLTHIWRKPNENPAASGQGANLPHSPSRCRHGMLKTPFDLTMRRTPC